MSENTTGPYDDVVNFLSKWKPRLDGRSMIHFPVRDPPSKYFRQRQCGRGENDLFEWGVQICLKAMRVFGPLESPCVLELLRSVTEIKLRAGQVLLKPGDDDNGIYVVGEGKLKLLVENGNEHFEVKEVVAGESIFSALGILAVLTGHSASVKKLSAIAKVESNILKISCERFNHIWQSSPSTCVRIIQTITTRLQKSTLHVLHHYFGFDRALINKEMTSNSGDVHVGMVPDQLAKSKLAQFLGLSGNTTLLDGKVCVKQYKPGDVIVQENSEDASLIYVLSGSLNLTLTSFEDATPVMVSTARVGAVVCGLTLLNGEPNFLGVVASNLCQVITLKQECFHDLIKGHPRIVTAVAYSTRAMLSDLVQWMDCVLDWELCEARQTLYSDGDAADALYVVLSGRLKSVAKVSKTAKRVIAEYGNDDLVGWGDVLTGSSRTSSINAIRNTELVKIPIGLLSYMKKKFSHVRWTFHLLDHCVNKTHEASIIPATGVGLSAFPSYVAKLKTVAIASITTSVQLSSFTNQLFNAIASICPNALLLTSDSVACDLEPAALESVNDCKLSNWLNEKEWSHSIIIYQCDKDESNWTKRCFQQADCVLMVANGQEEPKVELHKDAIARCTSGTETGLILLWPKDTKKPANTAAWLEQCGEVRHVSFHYHIRLSESGSSQDVQANAAAVGQMSSKSISDDVSRLARTLTNTSIGVVFGGGGARGAAHIGILAALIKRGIPIDFVGGVSIGSFIGGLYCAEMDIDRVTKLADEWFQAHLSRWKRMTDLTWPSTALTTGSSLNSSLQNTFKDTLIEDLWLPYFNVSTDITSANIRIHRTGPLWRYCRASMTVADLLPPLCDVDGHLLVDGGFRNNLPGDIMKGIGAGSVICIDVGAADDLVTSNYGDTLSGWDVLFNKVQAPSMKEILTKLSTMTSLRVLEEMKTAGYVHYLRPPVETFGLLDFDRYNEIRNVGFEYGEEKLNMLALDSTIPANTTNGTRGTGPPIRPVCTPITGPVHFTDLALLVKKIEGVELHGHTNGGEVNGKTNVGLAMGNSGQDGSKQQKEKIPNQAV